MRKILSYYHNVLRTILNNDYWNFAATSTIVSKSVLVREVGRSQISWTTLFTTSIRGSNRKFRQRGQTSTYPKLETYNRRNNLCPSDPNPLDYHIIPQALRQRIGCHPMDLRGTRWPMSNIHKVYFPLSLGSPALTSSNSSRGCE